MSRLQLIPCVCLATLVLGLYPIRAEAQPNQQSAETHEDVTVTCEVSGSSISITVDPWVVPIKRGDSRPNPLRWVPSASIDSIEVQPVGARWSRWPFEDRPGRGHRQSQNANPNARSGRLKSNVAAGTYAYQIILHCEGRDIVIDPDMEIS